MEDRGPQTDPERSRIPCSRRQALGFFGLPSSPRSSGPRSSQRRTPIALRPGSLVMLGALGLSTALWAGCGARTTRRPVASPALTGTAHGPETNAGPDELAPDGLEGEPTATPTPKHPLPGHPIKMTLYHVASEPCPDPAQVPLPKCGGGSVAMVSQAFKKSIAMQGTGKLCDGRLVGVQSVTPLCFVPVDPKYPWGLTSSGHPATPFRSLGVRPKDMPYGTWYYVRELDGVTLPFPAEGKKHDGCLRADDTGNGIGENHVDLFVGPKSAMAPLLGIVDVPVTLSPGTAVCTGREEF